MKEDRTNTKYNTEPAVFHEMSLSGKHCVTSWELFSDNAVQIQYKTEDGHEDANPIVNCVIAAYVAPFPHHINNEKGSSNILQFYDVLGSIAPAYVHGRD